MEMTIQILPLSNQNVCTHKKVGGKKWYFTQLTVTLLNCRKVWSNLSHISSVFCTIFCKRVHCDGSTSGFATSATITVNEFAKNSAKNTRNVTKILLQIFLQFCNVTVSCVGY